MSDNQPTTVRAKRWARLAESLVQKHPRRFSLGLPISRPIARFGRITRLLAAKGRYHRYRFTNDISMLKRLTSLRADIRHIIWIARRIGAKRMHNHPDNQSDQSQTKQYSRDFAAGCLQPFLKLLHSTHPISNPRRTNLKPSVKTLQSGTQPIPHAHCAKARCCAIKHTFQQNVPYVEFLIEH